MNSVAQNPIHERLEHSLIPYRWGMGFLFCMFTLPVLVPYYASKGLSTTEFFYIEGTYRLAYFLFNMLSGYISDRWSRKGCLLLGAACWGLGAGVIILGHGFWPVACGEIILALGMSFFVSPGRAYLYDALLSLGRADEHPAALSKQRATEHGLRTLAMAAGGFLFVVYSEAPQLAVLVTTSLSLLLFMRLDEPPRYAPPAARSMADYRRAVRVIFFECKGLREVMLYGALLSGATVIVFWGMQPSMRESGVSPQHYGLFMAAAGVLTSFFSSISHRIIGFMGARQLAVMLFIMMMVSLGVLAFVHHPLAMLAFILNSFVFVTVSNAFEDLMQRQVPSSLRATTLSFAVMCDMGFSAPLLFLTGFLMVGENLGTAFLVIAGIIGVLGLLLLAGFLRSYPFLKQEYTEKTQ